MLTPSSALEANYGITYQNKISFLISNTNNYQVLTRTQEISGAYVRSFTYRKFNPFVEAGPGAIIFLPIRNSGTTSLDVKQQTSVGGMYGSGHCVRNQPQLRYSRGVSRVCDQGADVWRYPVQHQQVVQHLQSDDRRGVSLLRDQESEIATGSRIEWHGLRSRSPC